MIHSYFLKEGYKEFEDIFELSEFIYQNGAIFHSVEGPACFETKTKNKDDSIVKVGLQYYLEGEKMTQEEWNSRLIKYKLEPL